MKCNDLKIGQKVFFILATRNTGIEDVFIKDFNENGDLFIERENGEIIFCELVKDDSDFAFAVSSDENNDDDYGFLYLNKEIIEQDDKFYDILTVNSDKIDNLKVEDKLSLIIFLEELFKKY